MNPQPVDRLHFDLQLAYARPVIATLAILGLLELRPAREVQTSLAFLIAYVLAAILILVLERALRRYHWRLPLACDILAAGIFLYLSPEQIPTWFLMFFVAFAAGYRWNLRYSVSLCFGLLLLGFALQMHWKLPAPGTRDLVFSVSLFTAAFLGTVGLAFLGDLNRQFAAQQDFLSRISNTMHVDLGLAESLRLLLEELCAEFQTEGALLAYRDADLERIFVWRMRSGEGERLVPENLPLTRADGFLVDDMEASLCWNSLEGRGDGFGWDRRNKQVLKILPRIPGPTQQEFGIKNFASVAFDQEGHAAGRLFLTNRRLGQEPFAAEHLEWFERIAAHISASLENVFMLRHLRARAIEAERSRISRDLHDGILQTLLSVEIQLDVLRRKLPGTPDQAASGLATLQQTVRNETDELRRMVTDLRPLRVQSADLLDLMHGFAERFRNESALALDLLIDAAELQLPDRICRDLFQIYRESLHNVKKHAHASHVVVKLWQNESQ